jgi:hypothetical protein
MKETRKEDDPAPTPSAQQESPPPAPAQDAKPAGLKYVFKIAPADPKNSFDFEDVADK